MADSPDVVDQRLADHRRGIAAFRAVVQDIGVDDLRRPTPCSGWLVGNLLAHQLGQDRAFAAALRGGASGLSEWASVPVGDDVPGPLLAALADQEIALTGFAASGRTTIWMPEILPDRPLPADRALAAHLVDLLVHSWDLGVSVGRTPQIAPDLARFCARVAQTIPDSPQTRGAGKAFDRALPGGPDEPPFRVALRLFGRDPDWSPPDRHASV